MRRISTTLDALVSNLAGTGRGSKQLLGATADALVAAFALWLAYTLRYGDPFGDFRENWYLFVLLPLATVTTFAGLGIYRWVVRSTNRRLYRQIIKGCTISAITLLVITYLNPPDLNNPRSLFAIYGSLLTLGTCGLRVFWQGVFDAGRRGEPIAIYGAGTAGRQLANLLCEDVVYRPVAFIDNDPCLRGSTVAGLPVLDGADRHLRSALRRVEVRRVVLAMPSLGARAIRRKLRQLERLDLPIQTMPDIGELVSGRARVDQLRDISIGDILGRTEVAPDMDRLGHRVVGRSVLVTGGGGSIGSELCRQIARLRPRRLVILDNCEANLYHITENILGTEAEFVPVLGSVLDEHEVRRVLVEHEIETVYHAAAYKHVPIVEGQPDQGARTNVFGTLTLVDAAIEHGVRDLVLISTDKAVRPANAMGASKRVAELVLQARAAEDITTRLSMVRFGNVLDSSGSVVPKFRQQIQDGGPITLTHPDITRYFMTIPEAAQLVLQASAITKGGDVFVLDMGEPVKILDLAKTMVRLYGKRLLEETGNPTDIEIEIQGLRPGEKMYEELFLTDDHHPTAVRKVFTARESWLPWPVLKERLDALREVVELNDRDLVREHLMELAFAGTEQRPVGRQLPDTDGRGAPTPVAGGSDDAAFA